MMHRNRLAAALAALLTLTPGGEFLFAQTPSPAGTPSAEEKASPLKDPFEGWEHAQNRHFRFIYEKSRRSEAESFAREADEIWARVAETYGTPPDRLDVILTGRTDLMGAHAEALGPSLWFYEDAPVTPEFGYRESWPRLVFTHELVHGTTFAYGGKKPSDSPFGPVIGALRLTGLPGWQLEGLAVLLETELTRGGRGRSPFFELQWKGPVLDGTLLRFGEIGKEERPPERQIYVAGYLIMRSIADRFGIGALARIEEIRVAGTSFPEAVKLVTGSSPEELWQDTCRGLEKRYARERTISEGIRVSPQVTNLSWYKPALVTGSRVIGLRKDADNPLTAAELDLSTGKEKPLFQSSFADERSLTASEDGKLIASLRTERADSRPGITASTDLWSWSASSGLRRLTAGRSLFQPTLSRSGNRLVAVESLGLRSRLVEIDQATGETKVLLESETLSYVQPALSPDGSTLAFLELTGERAVLETAPMPKYEFAYPIPAAAVTRVANATGPIIDLSDPSWTSEGKLLCASNEKGRLEVWQWNGTAGTRVVADPAGAYWAELTEQGVLYASFGGTGFTLKMKPLSEWGKVPDFAGPSAPGEPVRMGPWLSDYPDYRPWAAAENQAPGKDDESIPDQELSPGQELPPAEPGLPLGEGRAFYNLPKLQLALPLADAIPLKDGSAALGIGAFAYLQGHPLQEGSSASWFTAGLLAYPELSQAGGLIAGGMQLYTGSLTAAAYRGYGRGSLTEDEHFREESGVLLSWALPVRTERRWTDFLNGAFVTGLHARRERISEESFALDTGPGSSSAVSILAGIDVAHRTTDNVPDGAALETSLSYGLILSTFPGTDSRQRLSQDFALRFASGWGGLLGELEIRGRWFDLPPGAPLPDTLSEPRSGSLNTAWPGLLVVAPSLVFSEGRGTAGRLFLEKNLQWGDNSCGADTPDTGFPLNSRLDPWYTAGFEGSFEEGRARFAAGLLTQFREGEPWDPLGKSRIYLSFKLDALRGYAH